MVSDTLSRPRYLRPTAGIPVGIVRLCWYRASKEDKAMPLTDARCRSAQPGSKLQKLTDGGGLQLWLQPTGAKLWRFAYRFGGKQKLLAIGVYPTIPLARARQVREDARRLLADGLDPSVEKSARPKLRLARRPSMALPMSILRNCGARTGQRRPLQRSSGC